MAPEGLDTGIDVLPGGLRAEAQAHHTAGSLFGQVQRGHHLTGLALVAGGAGRDTDALAAKVVTMFWLGQPTRETERM